MENSLDKMTLKCNEAKKIKTIYEGLLEQLKEERRTWPNQLNNLERAICAQREELGELNAMNHDAQIAREAAKAELTKLEQSVYERKKERERELSQYKKQAEEKKDHAEKVEKRVRAVNIALNIFCCLLLDATCSFLLLSLKYSPGFPCNHSCKRPLRVSFI